MWDTGVFLMDLGTYSYYHSNRSYFWVHLLNYVKKWSSYWHELCSQLCIQFFIPPCLDSTILGEEICKSLKFAPQANMAVNKCCDFFPLWMSAHIIAVKQFLWNSSLRTVVLCKKQLTSNHKALPPVIHSSKWWKRREECDSKESTPWNFSSLLSCSLAGLYTFF